MKILVVEDDKRIAAFLERGLTAEGYHVSVERDGRDGLERIHADHFDLIILDRMLPYLDGMELCRVIRSEQLAAMVLMLTAKDSLQDKIEGLKGGADDYLTKPFAFDELLARIVALRRRGASPDRPRVLQVGDLVLDTASHRVTKAGEPLALTLREFELLAYLMINVDQVVSRQRLLSSVWDYGYDPGTKIVDVYIRYLRQKIDRPDRPSMIQTIRGVGYMIVSEQLSPNSNQSLNQP